MEFISEYYWIFLIAGGVLLVALFGYIVDKNNYSKYKKEVEKENRAYSTLEDVPDINNIAVPIIENKE